MINELKMATPLLVVQLVGEIHYYQVLLSVHDASPLVHSLIHSAG